MGALFDILFEIALQHRLSRWIVAAALGGLGVWYGGPHARETWIFIGIVLAIALMVEAIDQFSSRRKEKA